MITKEEFLKALETISKYKSHLQTPYYEMTEFRKKAKEYAKLIYKKKYNDPIYHSEVMRTMSDFESGFRAGMCLYDEYLDRKITKKL